MSARKAIRPAAACPEFIAFGRPDFSREEVAAVNRVMRSGWVGMGPEVIAFERELAAFTKAPHVIALNSCTSALHLALVVNGIGPGDEVICPSLTWCSTANAALYVGARPVFCDIDPGTLSLTPATVQRVLTRRTKAVMAVHYGGLAIDVKALRAALPARVAIIEDAAHAFGAKYPDGAPVGSSGNCVCFSFYANKNLSTAEGGAIALSDDAMADRLRSLRQHGLPADAWMRFTHPKVLPRHELVELGYKMNYTDLQAAIGRVQLHRQPLFHRRRLAVARCYARTLSASAFALQSACLEARHARHLFVVQLPEGTKLTRDEFLLALRKRNIGASIHYLPLHQMNFYRRFSRAKLPVTNAVADRLLTLPIGPCLSPSQAENIAAHCLELLPS